MDLDSIAADLYALLPKDFVSSRSAEVRAARKAGDRQLADAIGTLRRPTVGAWLANQLVRERSDQLKELLGLGTSMRKAQESGDGLQLRLLIPQRRQMIATLVSEAKELAHAQSQPLSENSTREVENTLEAAVASAEAAEALRGGRLDAGLTYSGFGPMELGASFVTERPKRTDGRASKVPPRHEGSTTAARRRPDNRSRLEGDLAEAEQRVKRAEAAVKETQQKVSDVQTERDALRSEIMGIERHLEQTRRQLEVAERRLVEAKHADKNAKKEAVRVNGQRDKAEASLHRTPST